MIRLKKKRLCLHKKFCDILGSEHCYYSPPSGLKLKYPCIIYQLADEDNFFADNIPYLKAKRWTITLIDSDPDSKYFEAISNLRFCSFDRFFTSDNLNHFVFTVYY